MYAPGVFTIRQFSTTFLLSVIFPSMLLFFLAFFFHSVCVCALNGLFRLTVFGSMNSIQKQIFFPGDRLSSCFIFYWTFQIQPDIFSSMFDCFFFCFSFVRALLIVRQLFGRIRWITTNFLLILNHTPYDINSQTQNNHLIGPILSTLIRCHIFFRPPISLVGQHSQ